MPVPNPQHAPEPDAPFAEFDLAAMPRAEVYKLLAGVILPRPIAWVVTRGEDESLNAAPFSFFNILASDPPVVAIGFSAAPDREGKDTLANLQRHPGFVLHLVPEELAEAMNVTATNAPRGTDETQLAGLALAETAVVGVPRIAAAPVALECKVWQQLQPGGSSTIVLAHVVYAHVRRSAFADLERLHIDPTELRLIGRMHGGGGYCTTREVFTIERMGWGEVAKRS